jgi:pimeloyl-ACP methyl ester carboxylesterase
VLLLHQVPASSRIWLPVMAELDPLPAIAPDMLNLGESDGTDRTLSLAEHAELLWQAASSIRPGPKIVIGHHTGAALAAVVAAAHPDEVAGLGLIGYPIYRNWREKLAKYERLAPVPADPAGDGVAAAWQFIHRAFSADASGDLVFEAFADRIRAGRVWYEGYVALWNADLDAVLSAAARPGRPTAVLAPDRDSLTPLADEVAAALGVQAEHTEGGSFLLVENPAKVASIIATLHADVTASTA